MKNSIVLFLLLFSHNTLAQLGASTPKIATDSLVVNNNSVLVSQLTTAQKLAIINPQEGLLVYDIDMKQFSYCLSVPSGRTINCNWVNFGNVTVLPNKVPFQKIEAGNAIENISKEALNGNSNILNNIIAELNAELQFMAADCEKKSADGGIYDAKKRKETYRNALAEFQQLAQNGPNEKIRQRAIQKIDELKQKIAQKGD